MQGRLRAIVRICPTGVEYSSPVGARAMCVSNPFLTDLQPPKFALACRLFNATPVSEMSTWAFRRLYDDPATSRRSGSFNHDSLAGFDAWCREEEFALTELVVSRVAKGDNLWILMRHY
jgi:hypothetical protein